MKYLILAALVAWWAHRVWTSNDLGNKTLADIVGDHDPLTSWVGRLVCRLTHETVEEGYAFQDKVSGEHVHKFWCREGCTYLTSAKGVRGFRVWLEPQPRPKPYRPKQPPPKPHFMTEAEKMAGMPIDAVRSYGMHHFASSGSIYHPQPCSTICRVCRKPFDPLSVSTRIVCPECKPTRQAKERADNYEI